MFFRQRCAHNGTFAFIPVPDRDSLRSQKFSTNATCAAVKPEIYVSTDIETDGPIPGLHSMLSLGSVAYSEAGERLGEFTINFETLPGATAHPRTVAWWRGFPDAWAQARQNPQPPEVALRRYVDWLRTLPGQPVFVAYPAGFDFTFVNWYLARFLGEYPFGFAALDLRTFAMAALGRRFHDCGKDHLPRQWFTDAPHTHVALEDAIEQGELFLNLLRASQVGR